MYKYITCVIHYLLFILFGMLLAIQIPEYIGAPVNSLQIKHALLFRFIFIIAALVISQFYSLQMERAFSKTPIYYDYRFSYEKIKFILLSFSSLILAAYCGFIFFMFLLLIILLDSVLYQPPLFLTNKPFFKSIAFSLKTALFSLIGFNLINKQVMLYPEKILSGIIVIISLILYLNHFFIMRNYFFLDSAIVSFIKKNSEYILIFYLFNLAAYIVLMFVKLNCVLSY